MISVMARLVFQVILFLFAAVYTAQECAIHPAFSALSAFIAHKKIIDITVNNNIHNAEEYDLLCFLVIETV